MFVSTAFAQAASGPGAASQAFDLMAFLPLILIFVVFYFLLIRPQQKKMNEHKEMISNIRRGDRVVTGGGIIGVVTRVGNDDEITVEIAEGVRVRCVRSTINLVMAKTEPVKAGKDASPAGDDGKKEEKN
jgi:preprotein translocase subunit YajC